MSITNLLVAILRLRGDSSFSKCRVWNRCVKRLVHVFAQHCELGLEKQLTIECPKPSLETKHHPFLKQSRMKGNKAYSQSLVARFQARGGGYISCKEELSCQQLGLSDKKSFGTRSASEYCARLLVKTTEVMSKVLSEEMPTLNLCMDCAVVSTEHVLSVVLRKDDHQFAAPTQVLPYVPSKSQALEALRSLRDWLDGKIPNYNKEAQKVMKCPNFRWKEFRTSTKTLLAGFANSLQMCMPPGWSLQDCVPKTILRSAPIRATRFLMTEDEKKAFGILSPGNFYCIFDHKTFERTCDFIASDKDFFHLSFSADDGTEAGLNLVCLNVEKLHE